jgi:patatin-like phospholipase/acyl hydrolase
MDTKYILSLDGGGIKGAFIARILDNLSTHLGMPVQTKFDLIVGTSIGGLIGLKLAQLRDDEKFQCQSLFTEKNTKRIFDKSFLDNALGVFQWKPVYDGKGKTSMITEILKPGGINEAITPVAVTAFQLGDFIPHIISSWESTECICFAADATSAAPVYFPPIQHKGEWFVDGGVGVNNPSLMAIIHAKKMFPNSRIKVLSIGTGSWFPKFKGEDISQWGLVKWIKHGLIDMLMTSTSQANDAVSELILGEDYLRYNHRELVDVPMDDTDPETISLLYKYGDDAFTAKKENLLKWLDK